MDAQKVDLFIATNKDLFPQEQLSVIKEKLLQYDDNKWILLSSIQFKNPKTALILSIFLGGLGIDRFYIGDTGLGIGKLAYFLCTSWLWIFLLLPICVIWYIIDLFLIMKATRQANFEKIGSIL